MYDKRSAWSLAALAPQRGAKTNLRDGNVAEIGFRAALRGQGGEAPGRALVIHQTARAVDRVEDALEEGLRQRRAAGKSNGITVEPFHDQFHRPAPRPMLP